MIGKHLVLLAIISANVVSKVASLPLETSENVLSPDVLPNSDNIFGAGHFSLEDNDSVSASKPLSVNDFDPETVVEVIEKLKSALNAAQIEAGGGAGISNSRRANNPSKNSNNTRNDSSQSKKTSHTNKNHNNGEDKNQSSNSSNSSNDKNKSTKPSSTSNDKNQKSSNSSDGKNKSTKSSSTSNDKNQKSSKSSEDKKKSTKSSSTSNDKNQKSSKTSEDKKKSTKSSSTSNDKNQKSNSSDDKNKSSKSSNTEIDKNQKSSKSSNDKNNSTKSSNSGSDKSQKPSKSSNNGNDKNQKSSNSSNDTKKSTKSSKTGNDKKQSKQTTHEKSKSSSNDHQDSKDKGSGKKENKSDGRNTTNSKNPSKGEERDKEKTKDKLELEELKSKNKSTALDVLDHKGFIKDLVNYTMKVMADRDFDLLANTDLFLTIFKEDYEALAEVAEDNDNWEKYIKSVIENFYLEFNKIYFNLVHLQSDNGSEIDLYNKAYDLAMFLFATRKNFNAVRMAAPVRRIADVIKSFIGGPIEMVQTSCKKDMPIWQCNIAYLSKLIAAADSCPHIWFHSLVLETILEYNRVQTLSIVDPITKALAHLKSKGGKSPSKDSTQAHEVFEHILKILLDTKDSARSSLQLRAKLYQFIIDLQNEGKLDCTSIGSPLYVF